MPAARNPERAAHFPAIEVKYGQPMSYWFGVMAELEGRKYPEQMAYLQENHGFSRTHANALIMHSRGSTSSRRFNTLGDYLKTVTPPQRATITAIFDAIAAQHPGTEVVIAWNKPMVKQDGQYLFGVAALKHYLLIAPFRADVLEHFAPRLGKYTVNKKTVQVPSDWTVDAKLVADMVGWAIKHPAP